MLSVEGYDANYYDTSTKSVNSPIFVSPDVNRKWPKRSMTVSPIHGEHPWQMPNQAFPCYPQPTTTIQSPYHGISEIQPYVTDRCVALDCEMVGVGPGGQRSVLARASIVDFYGETLFDTFVKVEERVTDYRTFVSGVREEDLTSAKAMNFGDCRKQVQKTLQGKILVGHGLQNDLSVLRVNHPWYNIRDTSLYQPFMKCSMVDGSLRPRRLRDLARCYLGIRIQEEGKAHDSLVDARATMLLYQTVQSEWEYWMACKRNNPVILSPHGVHGTT